MVKTLDFSTIAQFEWDKGNNEKNVVKHSVKNEECEEVFFNDPVIRQDYTHSQTEERYLGYGPTNKERLLVIAFTMRGEQKDRIRVISARDQDKKEKEYYLKHKNETK
jgi:uncharacterized DUF497 family protein